MTRRTGNPLNGDDLFQMTLCNPNPKSSKTKDGPVYRVSFELTQDEWQTFMDAETKGMVIECQAMVTHRNELGIVDKKTAKVDKPAPNGSQTVTKQSKKAAKAASDSPYGKHIAKLHTGGFFMCPAVWKVLGGSASYEKWCQLQPCIVCGDQDYVEVTQGGGLVGRCEFSHIRTAANSGTGIKPEFSGTPMCHRHHSMQHNAGEAQVYQEFVMRTAGALDEGDDIEVAAMSWLEKANSENIVKWSHAKLAVTLKVEKLSECHPKHIYLWAAKHKLLAYLPAAFKTEEVKGEANSSG